MGRRVLAATARHLPAEETPRRMAAAGGATDGNVTRADELLAQYAFVHFARPANLLTSVS
jgi:hypothetical protein